MSLFILMIEDSPDGVAAAVRDQLAKAPGIDVDLVVPSEVTEEALRLADVVTIDHHLEHWEQRESLHSVALRPRNGVALAAVLRSWLAPEAIGEDMTAFCLLTAHPDDLAGGSPHERRPQVLAHSKDLEWVFGKDDSRIAEQLGALAAAVSAVKAAVRPLRPQAEALIRAALAPNQTNELPDAIWATIERSQPPLVEIDDWCVPMALIRWLLHRILPYPTFLLDELHLAARLRVTASSLRECLQADSDITRSLEASRYRGLLASFDGPRWWRAAVDDLWWDLSAGGTASRHAWQERVAAASKGLLAPLEAAEPVVCVNSSLMPTSIATLTDTVRLQPDDWPPYAPTPRATRAAVLASARLRQLTADSDLYLLEEGSTGD